MKSSLLLRIFNLFLLLSLSLAACSPVVSVATPRPVKTSAALLTAAPLPGDTATPTPIPTRTPAPTLMPTPTPAVLVGAGDISICGQDGDDQTAALLAGISAEIFTAGDSSNEEGTVPQYTRCFDPSWGQYKDRIHPVPGNHDYYTPGAAGYFEYFGAAAGNPGEGWYSFDLGSWHIVMLNSNCNDVACGPHSPQVQWLRADLAASAAQCTLAVWHHPRWSSGLVGSDGRMSPAYRALYEAGAEIVISGHEHSYERLMPLDPDGKPDPQRGIRQFIVGTGGVNYRPFGNILPESEVRHSGTYGVLKLTLYPDRYHWEFIPVVPGEFTDTGDGACH